MTEQRTDVSSPRRLSYVGFAVIAVAYLAIIQVGGRLASAAFDTDEGFTTTRDVVVNMWIPLGAALVFTYGVVTWLGWWQPVLHEERRLRRWVWTVPIILAVCILLAINYAGLADKGVGFALALFIATQFVGWGEEGMFRGVSVTMLREHGLTEGKVALWSSLIFGCVHLTNAIGSGGAAVQQAIAVSFAGYFFYLIRRVSGGNALNSVLHGMFDFSLLSGTVILVDQELYPGAVAGILAYVIIAVVVIVGRKRLEPVAEPPRA